MHPRRPCGTLFWVCHAVSKLIHWLLISIVGSVRPLETPKAGSKSHPWSNLLLTLSVSRDLEVSCRFDGATGG